MSELARIKKLIGYHGELVGGPAAGHHILCQAECDCIHISQCSCEYVRLICCNCHHAFNPVGDWPRCQCDRT